jgi:hypothetical protein
LRYLTKLTLTNLITETNALLSSCVFSDNNCLDIDAATKTEGNSQVPPELTNLAAQQPKKTLQKGAYQ